MCCACLCVYAETRKLTHPRHFLQNRELQIMKSLSHINIVQLKYYFYSNGSKKDELYLNLVLEYMPETVYQVARQYAKLKQPIPFLHVKVRRSSSHTSKQTLSHPLTSLSRTYSCTRTSCSVHLHTSTVRESATATSNHRTSSSTPPRVC